MTKVSTLGNDSAMEQLLAEQADLISSLLSRLKKVENEEQAIEDVMICRDALQDYFVSIGLSSCPDRVEDENLNKLWETLEPWKQS